MSDQKIFGYDWDEIKSAQHKGLLKPVVIHRDGRDYGADPVGDGMFRMVPSGDIVDFDERQKRLRRQGEMK